MNKKEKREYAKDHYQKNKERIREATLRHRYGIGNAEYNELLVKQDYCCAVCGRHQDTFRMRLSVDHDHNTKEIRGLLCTYCNRNVVGRHRDPELFRKAAIYLDGPYTGWLVPVRKKKRRRKKK